MAELPKQLRRDLEALRVRAGPPAGAEGRVLAALDAGGFDLDPDMDPGPEPGPDAPLDEVVELGSHAADGTLAQLAWAGKVVAVTLAMTGAGLLAVRGTVLAARALAPEPAGISTPADPPVLEQSTADEAADELADEAAAGPTREVEPTSARALEPAGVERRRTPASRAQATSQTNETLAVELALLESARAAKDPRAALDQLRRHEQEFPRGALTAERELLMIERLCELGRFEQARARDRSFAAVHGDSPQHAKLRKVCPELAAE